LKANRKQSNDTVWALTWSYTRNALGLKSATQLAAESFLDYQDIVKLTETFLGRGHTKETDNCKATAISEKRYRFQAGNWFPD
jgi:hypothetical protein